MISKSQYSILSKYYEQIILDENYNKMVESIITLVKKYTNGNKGVDCCCGTGIVTRELKKSGYSVTGIDISDEMLEKAVNITTEQKLNITYLKQNIKNLKLFEKVNFITAINDGLNYLCGKDFIKAIKSFEKNLVKGGLLIFDISSEYKLKNILANNMYGDNSEDLSYIWFNTLKEDSVEFNLTFFEKDGDVYKRYDETQVEYIHTLNFVKDTLTQSGFEIIDILGENATSLKSDSNKQIFIARKNG